MADENKKGKTPKNKGGSPKANLLGSDLATSFVKLAESFTEKETVNLFNERVIYSLPPIIGSYLMKFGKGDQEVKIIPWNKFKNQLFDIVDERIKDDWEISGSILNSFIGFDEYIVLYFIKMFNQKARSELKMLEFLSSLKYYSDKWPRAFLFAMVCNITHSLQSGGFDLYLQNYFLFMYTKLTVGRNKFLELDDGYTLVPNTLMNEIFPTIASFTTQQNRGTMVNEIMAATKTISKAEKHSAKYSCIDTLMQICIREYKLEQKNTEEQLLKSYKTSLDKNLAIISLNEVEEMFTNKWENNTIETHKFPGKITLSRALLLAEQKNPGQLEVFPKEFIESVIRFGLTSPFPSIIDQNIQYIVPLQALEQKKIIKVQPKDEALQNQNAAAIFDPEIIPKDLLEHNLEKENKVLKKSANQEKSGNLLVSEVLLEAKVVPDAKGDGKGSQLETSNKSNTDALSRAQKLKLDTSSTLLAQHFSILRELKAMCLSLKDNLIKGPNGQYNLEEAWNCFDQ